ncbi:MAG: cell division protein FtsI (penicillin-binding protein 3), partial [Candidatus Marinamargulisbacteria bacterium]
DRKNSCITDVFEPGSIFKIITLSGVLEEEIVSPKTTLFVPETLKVYNRTINESHKREEGEQDNKSVTEIIVKSLNVGTSLLAEKLGKERFFAYIEQFGFGSTTGVELTGESKGILRPLSAWSGVDTATISFGQGIAVTPLQMATAISAIANGGLLLKPRLVRYITNKEETSLVGIPVVKKRRIISEGTANQVKQIMRKVVDRGTGTTAQIPGYKMAGKTGTAQKAKENGLGYEKGKYVASFIGFFPVYAPKYLILVVVDSPKKSIWGSTVAAPIFKNIAADIIHHYNIPPDHLVKSSLSSSNKIQ